MTRTWIQLSVLLLGLSLTDGYLNFAIDSCEFNSSHIDDAEYIYSQYYNKLEIYRFTSSLGKYVGYTELGVKIAARANSDTAEINMRKGEKFRYCGHNVPLWYSNIISKTAEPYAVLNSAPSAGSERVLVCSVYGFFPKDITVSWTNNHKPVTTGVTTTDLLPDSDWYYQVYSHLEYSPRSGDLISCVVEHSSLSEPLVLNWEGALSDGDRNKIAIGASGLVLGLILSLAGFIYYKRKSQGRILVPSH